ncbi:MAG: SGNH/GDSL hydrolase family protein [Planctomycetes bacterium]|jgi:lysophospholipase L1-like esterase|nr:SGNH/GDSL hydrolase family protein [Planctomycetota bacterium]
MTPEDPAHRRTDEAACAEQLGASRRASPIADQPADGVAGPGAIRGERPRRGSRSRAKQFLARAALSLIAALLALGAAEGVVRCIKVPEPYVAHLFHSDGSLITRESLLASGGIQTIPAEQMPPEAGLGFTFAPHAGFLMKYPGLDRPWLDARQGVEVAINGAGVRDSADLGFEKPAGQRRIVCLGDSVTFGWGVPIEMVWTEIVEADLRRDMGDVRTINCGFCGTTMLDESYHGLKHRFCRFEPDVVVLTICLNDLFECNAGMLHTPPEHRSPSRLWNLLATWWQGGPTALPAGIDHGDALLRAEPSARRGRYWVGGGPQQALRGIRDWCKERNVAFVVVLWPFLQCLDDRYPFATVHRRVAELCAAEGIVMLDLLDAFRGQRDVDMWVAPNDAHGNPVAQRIASPAIARFLRTHAR